MNTYTHTLNNLVDRLAAFLFVIGNMLGALITLLSLAIKATGAFLLGHKLVGEEGDREQKIKCWPMWHRLGILPIHALALAIAIWTLYPHGAATLATTVLVSLSAFVIADMVLTPISRWFWNQSWFMANWDCSAFSETD